MCRSPLAETICGAVPFETLTPHLVVWDDIGDTLPEFSTMMGIAKMAKLMHHDVVDDRDGSHDDAPVESKGAVRCAAAPPPLLGTNQHGSGLDAESRPVMGDSLFHLSLRVLLVPVFQCSDNCLAPVRASPAFRH